MSAVLADTSVWMRRSQPDVAALLGTALEEGLLMMTSVLELELLRTARSAGDYAELAREYSALPRLGMTRTVESRALEVQAALAERGYHRGPSPVDLVAAAAAEHAEAEVWHCDRHFELIADLTGQRVRRLGE